MRLKADQNSDKTSRVCFFIPQIIYGHSEKSGGGFDFSARGVGGRNVQTRQLSLILK